MNIDQLKQDELLELQNRLNEQYRLFTEKNLSLDLTRGKPAAAQLDLSDAMNSIIDKDTRLSDGTDARNYGGLTGIPEARQFGAKLMNVSPEQVLVGGNSSLTLMFQYLSFAWYRGVNGKNPWSALSKPDAKVKFICPVPGYDRHFTICEYLGIDMITVPFTDAGPDMDRIEDLVSSDPLIKGIWCVPKYSNPTGHCYSDTVVDRMANLGNIAGPDFRIMWDNAYAVHFLGDHPATLKSIYSESKDMGTEDNVIITGSTSKMTYAGAGISFLCASEKNLKDFQDYLSVSTIGPDKMNQLRHVHFFSNDSFGNDSFGNDSSVIEHMRKHRDILRPKFDKVQEVLNVGLGDQGLGQWTDPEGGYFVSFDARPGLATEIARLSAGAGVKLTPAGATFPYRQDPDDCNIRLAPTFPDLNELQKALDVFVVCVKLASVNQKLRAES